VEEDNVKAIRVVWRRWLGSYGASLAITCQACVSAVLASTSHLFNLTPPRPVLSLFFSLALYSTTQEIDIFEPRSLSLAPLSQVV